VLGRRILIAISALACALSAASAQDFSRDKWSGFYGGVTVGAAQGQSTAKGFVDCSVNGFLCDPTPHFLENGALVGGTASGTKSQTVFTGGLFAGKNWHADKLVYGWEGEVSFLHLNPTSSGSASTLNLGLTNPGGVPVVFTDGTTAEIDWFATFRGRVGYLATPDLLVYATGGLALTRLSVSNFYTDNWVFNGGGIGGSKTSSIMPGYALGGGFEFALSGGWTLRAEYLRLDFGSLTTSGTIFPVLVPAAANPFTSTADLTVNIFRSGLSLKF
jgi:outer membrane immunogenic protein